MQYLKTGPPRVICGDSAARSERAPHCRGERDLTSTCLIRSRVRIIPPYLKNEGATSHLPTGLLHDAFSLDTLNPEPFRGACSIQGYLGVPVPYTRYMGNLNACARGSVGRCASKTGRSEFSLTNESGQSPVFFKL